MKPPVFTGGFFLAQTFIGLRKQLYNSVFFNGPNNAAEGRVLFGYLV